MVFTKINYGKSVTKNLGDFNSVKIEFSAEIEVDQEQKIDDQIYELETYVNTFLNEEINKYDEKVTVAEKENNKSKPYKDKKEIKPNKQTKRDIFVSYSEDPDGIMYHIRYNDKTKQWYGMQTEREDCKRFISLEEISEGCFIER